MPGKLAQQAEEAGINFSETLKGFEKFRQFKI